MWISNHLLHSNILEFYSELNAVDQKARVCFLSQSKFLYTDSSICTYICTYIHTYIHTYIQSEGGPVRLRVHNRFCSSGVAVVLSLVYSMLSMLSVRSHAC